jgi:hypothetical protein
MRAQHDVRLSFVCLADSRFLMSPTRYSPVLNDFAILDTDKVHHPELQVLSGWRLFTQISHLLPPNDLVGGHDITSANTVQYFDADIRYLMRFGSAHICFPNRLLWTLNL